MKTRPKPKKISFIKLTTKSNKTENKLNNKNKNKAKKSSRALNKELLFINSPKNNFIPSTSKYNDKLLNKIKEFTLESQLLNKVLVQKSTKNANKVNKFIKLKTNDKKELSELKFNSLDDNKKIQNRKNNKFNTDRQVNPFTKNVIINTTTNNELYLNKNNKKEKNSLYNSKTKSLSKRKRKEKTVYENNLDLSKKYILKNNKIKRNISSNNRIIGHIKSINKRENTDEYNINNTEEKDYFNMHKSYNLISKNFFNFYYPDNRFLSTKNMLEKKWRKRKINYGIKEENERNIIKSEFKENNKNINILEFSYKKSKTHINSKRKKLKFPQKNNYEIKSENININNKKEHTLLSLHKNRIISSEINKDTFSFSEYKGINSSDVYSFENVKNIYDKTEEKNKYLIFNKKNIYKNKRFAFIKNFEKENTNIIGNIKNLNLYKLQKEKVGGSFYTKRKIYENEKKSPFINRLDSQNKKLSFLVSPNIKTSHNKKKRNEYSYDGAFNRYIKFHKLHKKRENSQSNSNSKSPSKSKSKSGSKSQIKRLKPSNQHNNKLNKIILLIKTNWGNNLKIGINNIKLIDKNNKNIPIKNSNFVVSKPCLINFIQGETKKLTIEYESIYTLKNIVILNGFNDIGIKYLIIENERGKLLWKGIIPKANLINIKSFYICVDDTFVNKRKILFSKTTYFNKIENTSNINNLKNINNINYNTPRNSRINESSDNLNKNYVLCDRIKIKLIDNYGNKDYIGLSGIQFYDNNNKLINIIQNKKDIKINETIINLKEKKILYNLFNNKNDTINPKYMFLTTNTNAFINIEFKQNIKISKIIFYNYNNNIYKDCATRCAFIDFYINNKRQNILNKPIFLYKPPGEEKIDYGQTFVFPFFDINNNNLINKINENFININLYNKNNKIIYNEEYQYYCPSFPFGFILKIEMISNYGNKNFIGIDNLQIFNIENKIIELFPNSNKNKEKDNIYPKIYTMPEGSQIKAKSKPLILSKLYNFNDVNNDLGENRVYFIFNQCIGISKISINKYEKYSEIAAKHIKIFLDDNIIFEGNLKNEDINNIYFCDKKYFNKEKKKMIDKKNNLSHEFDIKMNEFNKNINNQIISERYIEYEQKNGTKILKLSEY